MVNDWFDYKLENDPRFLERVEQARRSLKAGRIRLEDLPEQTRELTRGLRKPLRASQRARLKPSP
jgi:hypothetical protein